MCIRTQRYITECLEDEGVKFLRNCCTVHQFGDAVVNLFEVLRYKSEDYGFDSRWFHWNFSLT